MAPSNENNLDFSIIGGYKKVTYNIVNSVFFIF